MNAREAAPKDRPTATTAAAKRLDSKGTPQVRQSPSAHAVAHVIVVTSGRCVDRSDFYWRCSVCGKTHASRARGDLPPTIRRRGPHGPVVLHVVSIATEVAA